MVVPLLSKHQTTDLAFDPICYRVQKLLEFELPILPLLIYIQTILKQKLYFLEWVPD